MQVEAVAVSPCWRPAVRLDHDSIPDPSIFLLSYSFKQSNVMPRDFLSVVAEINRQERELDEVKKSLKLHFGWTDFHEQGCKMLTRPIWTNMKVLDLSCNLLGEKGCKNLIRGEWRMLQEIYLYHNIIGNNGCKILSKAKWSNLRKLDLMRNRVTEKGCQFLLLSSWNHLSEIEISCNSIGEIGYRLLKRKPWKIIFSSKQYKD